MHRTLKAKNKILAACLLLCVNVSLVAQNNNAQRIALVIGVKNYQHVTPLQNTLNDAGDMAASLKSKGFKVVEVYDPKTKRDMQDAVVKYFQLLENNKNGMGMVYYSGHGMQVDGSNYLVPTQANPQIKADLDDQCLNMDYIMRAIEQAGNDLNIFVLDACRNNPFRGFYRSAEQGLSMVATPKGSYIVYATKPGSVASDGTGRNGLFTSKLLKYLNTEGLNIEQVFKRVAADVGKESNDAQRPWIASDYTGDFYFTPGKASTQPTVNTQQPVTVEKESTNSVPVNIPDSQPTFRNEEVVNDNRYLTPLANTVQTQWIKREEFTMNMSIAQNGSPMNLGTVRVSIRPSAKQLVIAQQLRFTMYGATSVWSDSTVADFPSLAPRYYAAFNDFRDIKINFTNRSVNGYYYDKMTFAQTPISDAVSGNFFDYSLSTYMLAWLPLREGYQAQIPVYAVTTAMDRGEKTISIISTTSGNYRTRSGQTVSVFVLEVIDDATQITSRLFIGKTDRVLYEITMPTENGLMTLQRAY